MTTSTLQDAIRAHDATLAERAFDIWLGAEPTFTDRFRSDPAWVGSALGGEKQARARELVALLAREQSGALLMRSVGRQYPEEERPRWSYGILSNRAAPWLWKGPADPILGRQEVRQESALALRDAIVRRLEGANIPCRSFEVEAELPHRLVFFPEGEVSPDETLLARAPLGDEAINPSEVADPLAEAGAFLLSFGWRRDIPAPWIELPAFRRVNDFRTALGWIEDATAALDIRALSMGGFPPPVDDTLGWTTVTPDPGVIEINMCPHASLESFHKDLTSIYAAAEKLGLAPHRLHFNGDQVGSGGGGHVTLGGATPASSPFFQFPKLLPRLLAYLNRHPSLSYLFAPDSVGSSSQSPRPDEGARESFEELGVAIDRMLACDALTPETLWSNFAPLLTDRFGNTHRCEVNVEKLWNPWLPERGKLGLVEFRAFRMAISPTQAVARAALFRALAARVAFAAVDSELTDWGATLHERFALPFFQLRDLQTVLEDLRNHGFGLGEDLEQSLLDVRDLEYGRMTLGDAQLTVRKAREFWPLVGDPSAMEGTSRTIDPSTQRIEFLVASPQYPVRAAVGHYACPMVEVGEPGEGLFLAAIRFRAFIPNPGFHPDLPASGPIVLRLAIGEQHYRVAVHAWRPDMTAYPGLPKDRVDASQRRQERVIVGPDTLPSALKMPPRRALSEYTFDLRRMPSLD